MTQNQKEQKKKQKLYTTNIYVKEHPHTTLKINVARTLKKYKKKIHGSCVLKT